MQFSKVIITATVALVALTGCQNVKSLLAKRDNGSLDYVHATKLPPIKLPANQATAPFVPLYDVPPTNNATPLTNDVGKQYQLPTPPTVVH